MDALDFLLAVEVTIILAFAVLVVAGLIVDKLTAIYRPYYPRCDIDPRCHPAFVMDGSGQAWIGKTRVRL